MGADILARAAGYGDSSPTLGTEDCQPGNGIQQDECDNLHCWVRANVLGRYSFALADGIAEGELRPLHQPDDHGDLTAGAA
jgi:hypothetical protein